MKKLMILLLALLMVSVAYAAIPPGAFVEVTYDEADVPDTEFNAEFLDCVEEDYDPARDDPDFQIIPELDISSYDPGKNCYWKPFKHTRWGACAVNRCDFFPIPYKWTRFAVYIPSLDRTFFTEEIQTDTGRNEFLVEILSDGPVIVTKTENIDMEAFYAFFEGKDYKPPEKTEMPVWVYVVVLAIFIGIGWLIGTKVFGKKKKKRKKK